MLTVLQIAYWLEKLLSYLSKLDFYVNLTVLICFILNIRSLSMDFFSYRTRIDIDLSTKGYLIYPPIQICVTYDPHKTLQVAQLEKYRPKSYENDRELGLAIGKIPINELYKYGRLFHDIKLNCTVIGSTKCKKENRKSKFCNEISCENFFPIRNFIMYDDKFHFHKCTIFMDSVDKSKDYYREREIPLNILYRFGVTYTPNQERPDILPYINLAFDSLKMLPKDMFTDSYTLSLADTELIEIQYSQVTTHLLEAPYSTRCRPYHEFGHEGRRGCIRTCLTKNFEKDNYIKPTDVGIPIDFEQPVVNEVLEKKEEQGVFSSIPFDRICSRQCFEEQCENSVFDGSIKNIIYHSFPSKDDEIQHMYVNILRPTKRDTVYRHKPQISVAEYVSFSGGALGLFFGLSVLQLYRSLKEFHRNKKLSTVQNIAAPVSQLKLAHQTQHPQHQLFAYLQRKDFNR